MTEEEEDDGGLRRVTSHYRTRTKITTALIKVVCATIEEGNYVKTACAAAGVTKRTYDRWLNQAHADISASVEKSIYVQFADNVEQALAKAEVKRSRRAIKAGRVRRGFLSVRVMTCTV